MGLVHIESVFGPYDQMLACPLCREECGLHILAVVVNAGGSITVITHEGTTAYVGKAEGRGATIRVFYDCEVCGEQSYVKQLFHKGSVYLSAGGVLDGINEINTLSENKVGIPLSDLWRD